MNDSPAPKINLLAKRKKVFDEQAAIALRAKVWAGMVLVAYIVILVLIMGVNVYLSQRTKTTQAALNQAKMTITSSSSLVKQYEAVIARSKAIQTLLSERREAIQLWNQLQQMLPEGSELTQFGLEDSTLLVSIRATHVLIANQVVDMVERDIPTLGSKKTMANISRSNDASYKVDLELSLGKSTEGRNQ